ncbi:MAG TPA: hypothetical protein VIL65_05200 [Beijerinckiaceae bacterium]|jgi:hypothetical protein
MVASSRPAAAIAGPRLSLPAACAVALLLYGLRASATLPDVVGAVSLPDTDDAMRLVGVRDLLAGQGWFDLIQRRIGSPEGVPMHWSRLVDAPIAALVLLFSPVTGRALAEGLTAALWPALLFGAYLGLLATGARRLFGSVPAMLAVIVAAAVPDLAGVFAPGRVDHHSVQAILALGVLLAVAWPAAQAGAPDRAGLLGGGSAGLSLAIGLETLPFIALAGVVLALEWVREGDPRRLRDFGAGLAASSAGLFLVQTSPGSWTVAACDVLAPPVLMLAVGGGLAAVLLTALRLPGGLRLAATGTVGLSLLAAVGAAFPHCLAGPYASLPPDLRTYWLDQVTEAMPLLTSLRLRPASTLGSAGPLLAAALLASGLAWRDNTHRRAFLVVAAALWLGLALSCLQVRATMVASAVMPLAAGAALAWVWRKLKRDASRPRIPILVASFALFAPIWTAPLGLAAAFGRSAPAEDTAAPLACARSIAWLDRFPPTTVLADADLGAVLLQRTRHAVVAAPYHRAVAGLQASIDAFRGDEEAARAVMRRTGATLFVVCPTYLATYGPGPTFARALVAGATVPWLERVENAPLLVWRLVEP